MITVVDQDLLLLCIAVLSGTSNVSMSAMTINRASSWNSYFVNDSSFLSPKGNLSPSGSKFSHTYKWLFKAD